MVSGEEGAAAPAAVAAPKAEEKKAVEQLLASNNAYILEKFYTLVRHQCVMCVVLWPG